MIDGYCRTNLDEYRRVDWPEQFCAVPRIGERVEALNGNCSLKVVMVTHTIITKYIGDEKFTVAGIEIELHK